MIFNIHGLTDDVKEATYSFQDLLDRSPHDERLLHYLITWQSLAEKSIAGITEKKDDWLKYASVVKRAVDGYVQVGTVYVEHKKEEVQKEFIEPDFDEFCKKADVEASKLFKELDQKKCTCKVEDVFDDDYSSDVCRRCGGVLW